MKAQILEIIQKATCIGFECNDHQASMIERMSDHVVTIVYDIYDSTTYGILCRRVFRNGGKSGANNFYAKPIECTIQQ